MLHKGRFLLEVETSLLKQGNPVHETDNKRHAHSSIAIEHKDENLIYLVFCNKF